MENFEMNEDIRAQLKYYTAKLRRLQQKGLPLEEAIAAMMHREEDWREQAEAKEAEPPYLPGFGSEVTLDALRMLAESIVGMVRQYNALLSRLTEEPDTAAEAWLEEMLAALENEAEREAYRHMISQAASRMQQQLGGLNDPQALTHLMVAGKPGDGRKQFIIGQLMAGQPGAAKAYTGIGAALDSLQVAAAFAPVSGWLSGALRMVGVIGSVVEGCKAAGTAPQPLAEEIELSEESKAIHAAILYLLSGDGCLPEAFDDVSLRRIVPMVCMTQEMQGACTQETLDLDSAEVLIKAAWDAGIYCTLALLLESGLRQNMIRKALENPEQTVLIFHAACCILPVITSEILQMDQEKQAQLVKNMTAFYHCLNKLAEPAEAVVAQLPDIRQLQQLQQPAVQKLKGKQN